MTIVQNNHVRVIHHSNSGVSTTRAKSLQLCTFHGHYFTSSKFNQHCQKSKNIVSKQQYVNHH